MQACIDMNKVMEVARADEVTGNPYSVAITAPERIHFVKGTCKEESNWWLEVLQIFPRYEYNYSGGTRTGETLRLFETEGPNLH